MIHHLENKFDFIWQIQILCLSLHHNQNRNDMKYPLKSNYYNDQFDRINFHTEYRPIIKIKGIDTETKWMDINAQSAEILVKKLIKEFNIVIK